MAGKHAYQSATANNGAKEVSSTRWNQDHTVDDNSFVAAKLSASATDVAFGRTSAGAGAGEQFAFTPVARTLVAQTTQALMRTTGLGLGTAATSNTGDFEPAGAVATHEALPDPHTQYALESALGTMSTQNANNVSITGGSITDITDIALADGGLGTSLVDPNADRILFWDDSAGQYATSVDGLYSGTGSFITFATFGP